MQQLTLWEDAVSDELQPYSKDEKPNKNCYYVAISCLQKCVRRGWVEGAVNWAKVAWRIDPYRLFCRLWTITFEDCGRDLETLLALYRHRGGGKKWEPIAKLVEQMAGGTHCRAVSHASLIMKKIGEINTSHLFDCLKDTEHRRFINLCSDWDSEEPNWDIYDVWDYGIGGKNYDWTIELAQRAKTFDWSAFGWSLPYFFQRSTFCPTETVSDECEPLTLWNDFLPLEALDVHTQPGKLAIGILYKHNPLDYFTKDQAGDALFFAEGWLLRNHSPYPYDWARLLCELRKDDNPGGSWAWYLDPEVVAHTKADLIPEILSIREWMLEKGSMVKDGERLQIEYYKDHIELEDATHASRGEIETESC